ncbi:hypothetical protein IIA16_01090 [bacterium]|nr:hypothetical protein [bacterium]
MKQRNLARIAFGAALILLFAGPAGAVTTQSVGLDFTTVDTLVLENDNGTVNQGQAIAADYDNGYIDLASTPDHTLNVAANTTWQVAVKGDTAETAEAWLKTGGDCPVAAKAVGTIKWSTNNFSASTPLTAVDAVVATGGATASTDILMDYRTDLSWTVDTGICTYDYDSVVFTLTAT